MVDVTPGTGAVYSVAAGVSQGGEASVVAAFGCALARDLYRRPHQPSQPEAEGYPGHHPPRVVTRLRRTLASTYACSLSAWRGRRDNCSGERGVHATQGALGGEMPLPGGTVVTHQGGRVSVSLLRAAGGAS